MLRVLLSLHCCLHSSLVVTVHGETRRLPGNPFDGKWHYICATWDASERVGAVIVDGVQRRYGRFSGTQLSAGGCLTFGQQTTSDDSCECGSFHEDSTYEGYISAVSLRKGVVNKNQVRYSF